MYVCVLAATLTYAQLRWELYMETVIMSNDSVS